MMTKTRARKNLTVKLIATVAISVLLLFALLWITPVVGYAEEIIGLGTVGTCSWKLTSDGLLSIYPTDGVSGSFSPPSSESAWKPYASLVKSVVIAGDVTVTNGSGLFYNHFNMTEVSLVGTTFSGSVSSMFKDCSSLPYVDMSGTVMSGVTDMSDMFYGCGKLTGVDFTGVSLPKATNMSYLFYNCSSLESFELSSLDTSAVTMMQHFFDGCINLTDVGFDGATLPNIKNMSYMFSRCISLPAIDFDSVSISGIELMSYMFDRCESLTSLDLSSFNTSKVTNMSGLFNGCSALETLNISGMSTVKVTTMGYMFNDCSSLRSVNLASFSTANVTNMRNMFSNCSAITDINLSSFNTGKVTSMESMFANCSGLESLDLSSFNTPELTTVAGMFAGCSNLAAMDLRNFSTGKITETAGMFAYCDRITSINFGTNTFPLLKLAYNMFLDCKELTDLTFNPGSGDLQRASSMFEGCESLSAVTLDGFVTSSTNDFDRLFAGCQSLVSISMNNWNTSSAISLASVFLDCYNLPAVDLSGWDTSNVYNFNYCFSNCKSLTSLNLSSFNTARASDLRGMFDGAVLLDTLDISGFTMSQVSNGDRAAMFRMCDSLAEIKLGPGFVGYNTEFPKGTWTRESTGEEFTNTALVSSYTSDMADTYKRDISANAYAILYQNGDFVLQTTRNPDQNEGAIERVYIVPEEYMSRYDLPWYNELEKIFRIITAERIQPIYMNSWFSNMPFLSYVDFSLLDCSMVQNLRALFSDSDNVTTFIIGNDFNFDRLSEIYLRGEWIAQSSGDVWNFESESISEIPHTAETFTRTGNVWAVLYADGQLVLQNSRDLEPGQEEGAVIYPFNPTTDYLQSRLPWYGNREKIKSVRVRDSIAATSMSCWFNSCTNLISVDLSNLDTSNMTKMYRTFAQCSSLEEITWGNSFSTANVRDMRELFENCSNLEELDLSGFNTSSVQQMVGMFAYCSSLKTIDLSSFNTQSVTAAHELFKGCSKLQSINFGSNFDLSGIESFAHMFNGCSSLTSIVLPFNTENAKYMYYMFYGCTALQEIDLSGFDTSSVTNTEYMFYDCRQITELDLSNFDTRNVTRMPGMFSECKKLEKVVLGENFSFKGKDIQSSSLQAFLPAAIWVGSSNGVKMTHMQMTADYTGELADTYTILRYHALLYSSGTLVFQKDDSPAENGEYGELIKVYDVDPYGYTEYSSVPWYKGSTWQAIKRVVVKDPIEILSGKYWFYNCSNLTDIDLSLLDTTKATNMGSMFAGCTKINSITLGENFRFKGDNITASANWAILPGSDVWISVSTGEAYTAAELRDNYTTDMAGTYEKDIQSGCIAILYENGNLVFQRSDVPDASEGAIVGLWNIPGTTSYTASSVPWYGNRTGVKAVIVKDGFAPTSLRYWFASCTNLITADLRNLNMSKATNMSYLFNGDSKLESVLFGDVDTSKVVNFSYMFNNCSSLTELDLSGFDTENVTAMNYMFAGCKALKRIDASSFNTSKVTNFAYMFNTAELEYLDISSFDSKTSATNMQSMFSNSAVSQLREVKLGQDFSFTGKNITQTNSKAILPGTKWQRKSTGDVFAPDTLRNSYAPDMADTYNRVGITAVLYSSGMLAFYNRLQDYDSEYGEVLKEYVVDDKEITNYTNVPWHSDRNKIIKVKVMEPVSATSISYWFYQLQNLTSADLTLLDTTNLSSVAYAFCQCNSLSSVNLTGFNTSNVTNFNYMFYFCKKLKSLDVSSFDTRTANSMYYMFTGSGLASVKLGRNFSFNGNNIQSQTQWAVLPPGLWQASLSGSFITAEDLRDTYNAQMADTYVRHSLYAILYENGDFVVQSTDEPEPEEGQIVEVYEISHDGDRLWSDKLDLITNVRVRDHVAVASISSWFSGCVNLTTADLSNLDADALSSIEAVFAGCTNLQSVHFGDLDMRNVKYMQSAFSNCENLETLDVDGWDVRKTIKMYSLFNGCKKIQSLDLSGWDSAVADSFYYMFMNCTSLETLDIGNLDTTRATGTSTGSQIYGMFSGCSSLQRITLGPEFSFVGDGSASSQSAVLPAGNWMAESTGIIYSSAQLRTEYNSTMADTYIKQSVQVSEDESAILYESGELVFQSNGTPDPNKGNVIEIYRIPTAQVSSSSSVPWYSNRDLITSVVFADEITPAGVAYWFYSCQNLVSADLTLLNTSNVKSLAYMFYYCESLQNITGLSFDTAQVTTMNYMFYGCKSLTSLDLSSFTSTSAVKSMAYMFSNCTSLEYLDISSFTTTQVTSFSKMFDTCSLMSVKFGSGFSFRGSLSNSSLTNRPVLPAGMWQREGTTSSFTHIYVAMTLERPGPYTYTKTDAVYAILYENGDLVFQKTLDKDQEKGAVLRMYSVDTITDGSSGDYQPIPWGSDSRIKRAIVKDAFTSKATKQWFSGCSNLESVDFSLFDASATSNAMRMFMNCNSLVELDLHNFDNSQSPYALNAESMFSGCSKLKTLDISSMDLLDASSRASMFGACNALTSVTLGENFSFKGANTTSSYWAILPEGNWHLENDSENTKTAQELRDTYNGATMSGTYVRDVVYAILYDTGELVISDSDIPDSAKGNVVASYTVISEGYTTADSIPWYAKRAQITSVSTNGNVAPKSTAHWFHDCVNIQSFDLSHLSTANTRSMASMFQNCRSVGSIDLSLADTSKVTDMSYLFSGCVNLDNVDISNLNTQNVSKMTAMFYDCKKLSALDLDHFNTANVTDMRNMFANCNSLTKLKINSFDTTGVTKFAGMFMGCSSLASLDISNFIVNENAAASNLFLGCSNLSKVILGPDFDFINQTNKLPQPPAGEFFTGKWEKEDHTVEPYTATALANSYKASNGNLAGAWIWQKNLFGAAVRFDPNGGNTTAPNVISETNTITFTLPDESTTVRPNYALCSWNTEQDGSGTSYTIGETVTLTVDGGTMITVYAQWRTDTRVPYTVERYMRNVQGSAYNVTIENKKTEWFYEDEPDGTVTIALEIPTGFKLKGAYLSDTGNTFNEELEIRRSPTIVFTPATDGSSVVKIYYDRQMYKVHFDGNGADFGYMADQTFVREIQTLLKKNDFEKSGTFFIGWNTEVDGSGTTYADQQPVTNLAEPDTTLTLYAQWFAISGSGGPQESTDGSLVVSAKAGQTIVIQGLPNGTKYSVEEVVIPAGWSEVSTVQDKSGGNATIAPNITKEAEVTNRYQARGRISLEAHVKLEGGPLQSNQFVFMSSDPTQDLEVLSNGSIDKNETIELDPEGEAENPWYESGPVSFSEIIIEEPGIYTYYITQIDTGDERIDYDIHTEEVTVVATDNGNGTLDVEAIYDADGPLFINRMRSGAVLTVSKEIRNETAASQDQEFTFTVDVRDSENMLVSGTLGYKIYQTSQIQPPEMVDEGTIAMGGTFQMKGGQYIELTGIPYGATYEITESPQTGWEQISAEGSSGFMEESPLSAQFINVYSTSGSAQIEATKTFIGGTIQREQFEFELHRNDGTLVESVYAGIDGSIVFTPLDFDESDAGQTYSYYIVEKAGSGDIIYDQSIKEVSIYIEDDGIGHMATEVTYANNDNVFVNRNITTLIVETEVHGNIADLFDVFDYTMVLTNGDGTPFTGDITPEGDQMNWAKTGDGTYSFSLQARTSTTVKLPSGIHFVITETPKDYLVRIAMTQGNGSLANQSSQPVAEEETDGAVGDTVVVFKNYLISVVPTGIDDVATIGMDIAGIAVLAGVLMMLLKKRKSKKAEAEQ